MRRLRIFLPPGIDGRREGLLSFWKAEQLLALATMVSARHSGITLDDVIARFNVSKRTAQRMLRALESQFSDASTTTDSEGRKRWHLPSGALRDLMSLSPEELAALDLAVETLQRSGLGVESEDLLTLREKILALVPRSKAARLELIMKRCSRLRALQHVQVLVSASIARLLPPSPKPSKPADDARPPV